MGTQVQVGELLNKIPEVTLWRYDMPNAFYVISEASAQMIGEKLQALVSGKGRCLITEISPNGFGWLTNESWYIIRNKEKPPTPM